MLRRVTIAALFVGALLATRGDANASPASLALRLRASNELYNLDEEAALTTWRQAVQTDPADAAAWRGLAGALLAHIAMLRGTMTVDSYLGRVTTDEVRTTPPPSELTREFDAAIARSVSLARALVAARPRDAHARYELGAAIGLRASYLATIDGSLLGALRAAREAFDANERALALDPSRADAGLIVGTYRYLVSTLSMPMRVLAYTVGFGGGHERGLALIERAAEYHGDNQTDARLVLVLLDNRDGHYDKALEQLAILRAQYPRNRLFWLETASTLLRAGRATDAERMLNEGFAMLEHDSRPRMLGEDALWYYRRGMSRVQLSRPTEARADFERALGARGRPWVEGRAHLELGRLALQHGTPQEARRHLLAASTLGDSDRDGLSAASARELMKQLPSR